MKRTGLFGPPWAQALEVALIAALLLWQGFFLFRRAQNEGRRAWFWGLWGLLHFPTPLIVYKLTALYRKNRKGNG